MKKIFKHILLASILAFFICSNIIQAQDPPYFINGRTYFLQDSIWYVENSMTGENFRVDVKSITVKLKNPANFSSMENLVNNIGIEIKRENILGYIDIFIPPDLDIFQVWETLNNTRLFESVEINSFGELLYLPPPPQTPNDPYYGQQYHLNHSTYPDINAPEAWDLCNNFGEGVIIAILDNGFDYEHPDLIDNVWPSVGWDFLVNEPILVSQRKRWHATMVAGVAGARTNNNLGISGVAGGWFPSQSGSQIMSVVMTTIFEVNTEITDDAIIYAADNGAKILNMSWFTDPLSSINAALDYAYNSKGCLIVAATGNNYNDTYIKYPANNQNVIAVSGIKKNWDHFGNTGYQIELTAPAEDIFTTYYIHSTNESTYESLSGTSLSSPMVCRAAALLVSNFPGLTNFDIRRILKESAFTNFTNYNELYFGDGLLKIDSSLLYAENMPNEPTGVSIYAPIGGNPTISWNPVPDTEYYKLYRSEPNFKMLLNSIITTTDTFYTDNQVTVVHPKFAPLTYYYRATSVDNGYESPVSSEVSVGSNTAEKIVGDGNTKTLKTVELFHNFPNPFNPATIIKYRINEDSFVQLKVYDILGRLVKTLVSILQAAGEYSIEFNGEDLSAGAYCYTLSANEFYQTKKMILLP